MTPDRFKALAEAYGADIGRWPEAERGEAERLLARAPEAAAIVSDARRLDEVLASYALAPPAADLARRVKNDLLRRRARPTRLRGWLSALGAMGVLGAGAVAGAAAMALVALAAPPHPEGEAAGPLYEQTSFGDLIGSDEAAGEPVRS
jgi:anti-sigma factor RsiW